MEKILTIGITTYNNVPFISELIYTLKNNLMKNKNLKNKIDIIIVDDCSNIDSEISNIEDENIKVLVHQENMGSPSYGRNEIIELANSKYILFMDGDDNFIEDISKIVDELENKDADILVSDVRKIANDGIIVDSPFYLSTRLFNNKSSIEDLFKMTIHQTGIWSVYKLSFLKKHNLKYSNEMRYEDNYFMCKLYLLDPKIDILSTKYYGWRNNFSSFTYEQDNLKHRVDLYHRILELLISNQEHTYAPWLFYSIWNQTYINIVRGYPEMLSSKYRDYYELLEKVSKKHENLIKKLIKKLDRRYIDKYTKIVKITGIRSYLLMSILRKVNWMKRNKYPIAMNVIFKMMKIFPVEKQKVFMTSHYGNYNDNSKYLYLEMKKNFPDKKIRFAVKNSEKYNSYYNVKDFFDYDNKLKFFFHHYTAQDIYFNSWYNPLIKKRKTQKWYQLWHGIPYKKVFSDINTFSILNSADKIIEKENSIKNWDTITSVDEYNDEIFSKLFPNVTLTQKEYPKVKWLERNQNNFSLIAELKEKFELPKLKKIALYAPTYRAYKVYFNYNDIINFLSADEILIIHMHPMMNYEFINYYESNEKVIFLKNVEDIQEVILISDRVITDYSSIAYDFKKMNKNITLYQPDYDLYNAIHGIYSNALIAKNGHDYLGGKNEKHNKKIDS